MNIWKEFKKGDYIMGVLKSEYKSFLDDIEKNIKNKEDLEYIKKRFSSFLDIMLDQMDYISEYKKEQIDALEKNQREMQEKIDKMQEVLDNIEKDIYSEEGFDFEITCPYCNYEFFIDIDENKTEVECPECKNSIELDWGAENEEDGNHSCHGDCHGCHGCSDEDDDM